MTRVVRFFSKESEDSSYFWQVYLSEMRWYSNLQHGMYSHDFPMFSLLITERGSAPAQEQRRQAAESLAGAPSGMEGKKHCIIRSHMILMILMSYVYTRINYKVSYHNVMYIISQ